jgi:lycopene cyclase domain-containing protein
MFGQWTYVIWLLLFVGLPLVLLGFWQPQAIWRQRRALGWTLVGAFVGGWAWDALAVRLGAWYYDPGNIVNVWIAGLPLEEWIWIAGVSLMFAVITVVIKERERRR